MQESTYLGTEKIGRLLRKFAIALKAGWQVFFMVLTPFPKQLYWFIKSSIA